MRGQEISIRIRFLAQMAFSCFLPHRASIRVTRGTMSYLQRTFWVTRASKTDGLTWGDANTFQVPPLLR